MPLSSRFFPQFSIMALHQFSDLVGWRPHEVHRDIMIHKINDGRQKFIHISCYVIRTGQKFRRLVSQVGGDQPVKVAFFLCVVKMFQAVCEQTEGSADKYPVYHEFF